MQKLSILMSLLIAGLMLISTSCGTSSSASPGDIAKKLWTDLEKGNFDAIISAQDMGGKEMDDDTEKKMNALLAAAKQEIEKKGGIKSIEVVKEEIDEAGEKADVELKIIYGNGEEDNEDASLVKVDGKWKFEN